MTNKFFGRTTHIEENVTDDILHNDLLRHAYQCYQNALNDGAMPTLKDFLRQDIAKVFGYICIVKYSDEGFIYEVVGRSLISIYGKELAGLSIKDAYKEPIAKEVIEHYEMVRELKKPIYGTTTWKLLFRELGFYKLIMPVLDGEDHHTKFVTCVTPTDLKIKSELDWKTAEDVQAFCKINEMTDSGTL